MANKDNTTDYQKAKVLGLTKPCETEDSEPHHPTSIRLMKFLEDHDLHDYGDYFGWKVGGDGDNGEILMTQMDAFFKLMDNAEAKGI